MSGDVRARRALILMWKEPIVAMRVRMRLLLTSFNKAIAEYVLARLELWVANPDAAPAPLVARLGAFLPLDEGFRDSWPRAHAQVREAIAYMNAVKRGDLSIRRDGVWERFAFSVRQMAQYASGIDWLQTTARANRDDVTQ